MLCGASRTLWPRRRSSHLTSMHPFPESHGSGETAMALRQSALLKLSTSIAAAHSEREVCESLVQGLYDDALGYNLVGVFLLDPETGDRVLQASVGWEGASKFPRVSADCRHFRPSA